MHSIYDLNAILTTQILDIILGVFPHQIKNSQILLKSTTCHLFDVNNKSRLALDVHSAHYEQLHVYICVVSCSHLLTRQDNVGIKNKTSEEHTWLATCRKMPLNSLYHKRMQFFQNVWIQANFGQTSPNYFITGLLSAPL